MSETHPQLQTERYARKQAIAAWMANAQNGADNSGSLLITTKPVYDTNSLSASVIANDAAAGVAYAKFAKGSEIQFFTHAVGTNATLGGAVNFNFTEAQTNLTESRKTPGGNSEQVIEAFGCSLVDTLVSYAPGDYAKFTGSSDAVLLSALAGASRMIDPSGLVKPLECDSPFMLENVFQRLASSISLELQFDNADRTEKLCTLDQIPQAAGGSYLRSNGEPNGKNRFELPEGYRWKKHGSSDSVYLTILGRLRDDVIVPISLPTPPVGNVLVTPTALHVLFRLSIYGVNIRFSNTN